MKETAVVMKAIVVGATSQQGVTVTTLEDPVTGAFMTAAVAMRVRPGQWLEESCQELISDYWERRPWTHRKD